jgi:hypothetical protein
MASLDSLILNHFPWFLGNIHYGLCGFAPLRGDENSRPLTCASKRWLATTVASQLLTRHIHVKFLYFTIFLHMGMGQSWIITRKSGWLICSMLSMNRICNFVCLQFRPIPILSNISQ